MPELTHHNTLFIGLGGTGGRVLKELRQRMAEEAVGDTSNIGFVYVDSSRELMHDAEQAFYGSEYVDISVPAEMATTMVAHPECYGALQRTIKRHPDLLKNYHPGCGAMQDRCIGTLLMRANVVAGDDFSKAVLNARRKIVEASGSSYALSVYIVAGLAGGTGSGALIEAIATLFSILGNNTELRMYVVGVLPFVPLPSPQYDTGRYYANAYAVLRELNALSTGNYVPEGYSKDSLGRFNLFLFGNQTEHDIPLNVHTSVANALFSLSLKEQPCQLRRFMLDIAPFESMPECEGGQPVRMTNVFSIGLKRITYPRRHILRYIAYKMAAECFLQMQFSNYTFGYREEAKPCHTYMQLRNDKALRLFWQIDHEALTLQRPIIDSDTMQVRTFGVTWGDAIYRYDFDLATLRDANHPLSALEEYAKEYYYKLFRKYGVQEYYKHKSAEVYIYSDSISSLIERDFLQKWLMGEAGLIDLINMAKDIIHYLKDVRETIPDEINHREEYVESIIPNLDDVKLRYETRSLLQRLTGVDRKLYVEMQRMLESLYIAKTEIDALQYSQCLLARLITDLEDKLIITLERLSCELSKTKDNADMKADDLARRLIKSDISKPYFCLSDNKIIEAYIAELRGNEKFMSTLAAELRHCIKDEGDVTLRHFISLLNSQKLEKVIETIIPRIKDFDMFITEERLAARHPQWAKEKLEELRAVTALLKAGVLSRLQEIAKADKELHELSLRCLSTSFGIRFNPVEMTRMAQGNMTHMLQSTFVSMPYSTNPENEDYARRLATAMRSAAQGNIEIDTEGSSPDEISIMTIQTAFPLRMLDILPTLRQQYDQLPISKLDLDDCGDSFQYI